MKKTLLFLLVLVLAGQVTAQQRKGEKNKEAVAIGIKGGASLAHYTYVSNNDLNTLPYDTLLKRVKPMFGIQVEIPLFNGLMFISPEVAFAVRGDSRVFQSATWGTNVRYRANVNYLEARLPIAVAIPAASWLKPYVFAAPMFGLALPKVGPFNSEITQYSLDKPQSFNQTVAVDSSNMAPYDYGFTAGAGLRFLVDFKSFKMIVKLEGGYHMGLKDTYSVLESQSVVPATNVQAYSIDWKRLNRGIEASLTIAIPLDFHGEDDCFYWSEIEKKKNKNRGYFGF